MLIHKSILALTTTLAVGCSCGSALPKDCNKALPKFKNAHCKIWNELEKNPIPGMVIHPAMGRAEDPNLKTWTLYYLASENDDPPGFISEKITDTVENIIEDVLEKEGWSVGDYREAAHDARSCIGLPDGMGATPEMVAPSLSWDIGGTMREMQKNMCANMRWDAIAKCEDATAAQIEAICNPQKQKSTLKPPPPPQEAPPPRDSIEECADTVETIPVLLPNMQDNFCAYFMGQETARAIGKETDKASKNFGEWAGEKWNGFTKWLGEKWDDSVNWVREWLSVDEPTLAKRYEQMNKRHEQSKTDPLGAALGSTGDSAQNYADSHGRLIGKPLQLAWDMFVEPPINGIKTYLDPNANCWERLKAQVDIMSTFLIVGKFTKVTRALEATEVTITQNAERASITNGVVVAVTETTTQKVTVYSLEEFKNLLPTATREMFESQSGMMLRETSSFNAVLSAEGSAIAIGSGITTSAWAHNPDVLKGLLTVFGVDSPEGVVKKLGKEAGKDFVEHSKETGDINCADLHGKVVVTKYCGLTDCLRLVWYTPDENGNGYNAGTVYLIDVRRI